jgi:4'-phosphopantetheinyl transferase
MSSPLLYDRYTINLDIDPIIEKQYYSWLSPDECDRAQRLSNPLHRRDFIAARGALRSHLAQYIDCKPGELQFDYGKQGKPKLINDPNLQFNLAHSHQRALLGVCSGTAIGIDLEKVRPVPKLLALAKRFFQQSEYETIAATPETLQPALFFAYWTCKEAYLKATGTGLSQIAKLELQMGEFEVKILQAPCKRRFRIEQIIDLERDFIGAVAIEVCD